MKTLLLFTLLQANLHLILADWLHPHYSYRCLENGDVILFGVHDESTIEVDGRTGACKTNHTAHVYVIKKECLTPDSATISVYDKVFDGRTAPPPSPAPTIAPNVQGGYGGHKFDITCKDIPGTGIERTVAHVFQDQISKHLPNNIKEVGAVEMRFKAVKNWIAPDISTIYIGDEFYMFIKYMGDHPYTIIPENCTAFDETWIDEGLPKKPNHMVKLWDITDFGERNDTNDCVEHKELLEGFGSLNKTLIYAKMYGFRFEDKDYVTITCQVKIYNSISVDDKTNLCMNIPANPVSGRRKRNIENVPFQTHALTKRLRVFDNENVYLAENNGQIIKWKTSLWMMIFALHVVALHTRLVDS